jgi:hypothetical protein
VYISCRVAKFAIPKEKNLIISSKLQLSLSFNLAVIPGSYLKDTLAKIQKI